MGPNRRLSFFYSLAEKSASKARRHSRGPVITLLVAAALAQAACRSRQNSSDTASTSASSSAPTLIEPEAKAFAGYAGSTNCRSCHASEFDQWTQSNHGLAERPLEGYRDRAAFVPPQKIQHGSQTSEARLTRDDKPEIITLGYSPKPEPYLLSRVIGNNPLKQFLVATGGGRFQAMELAFDPLHNQWFDVYGNEDRKPGEWGHWTGRGMTWNTMCAACHNTRLRKNYDEPTDAFHTTMAESTVSCEACHGPMKDHANWRAVHQDPAEKDPTTHKQTPQQILDTCGSCHSRRTELTGDFKPGDAFADHYALAIPDETALYYPDGQVHEEDYEFASFLGSKMYAAGVRCMDCHNPHTAKTMITGNDLCMRCHVGKTPTFPKAPVINVLEHTYHKPGSTGSQCINCHMPQTVYMQRHSRHDHGFTIPDPQLTVDLGIPNACNRCHTDKDAPWAANAARIFWGDRMNRPTQERARVIAAARKGEVTARDGLLKLVDAPDQPAAWKATAVRLLDAWLADPMVSDTISKQQTHPDAMVRASVARAMEPLVTENNAEARKVTDKLLADPVRSVRLAAAWTLRSSLDPNSQPGRELQHMLDLGADEPTGQLQKGAFAFARNDTDGALQHYLKAVQWDPNSAPLRHELAVAYSVAGNSAEALKQLQEAVKIDPNQTEYHFKLALAWSETSKTAEALKELEATVKLDPGHARAWYNLGLARNAQGDTAGAIAALKEAEKLNPGDADIPYARATIHAHLGQMAEAQEAATRAVQINPRKQEAIQLLYSLQKGS